jgi:hypothetical protein
MKKILLTFVLALAANSAFSQRDIDWSIEEILLPTEVRSTGVSDNPSNTSTFTYKIVCKNISEQDTVYATDTVALRVVCIYANQLIYAFPSTQNPNLISLIGKVGKKLKPNDTVHVTGKISFPTRPNNVSLTLTLNFYSEIFNRNPNTGIPREATATLTNNTKTKDVVWKGPQGWGLNVNDLTADAVSIYPNPAKNNVNIQSSLTSANGVSIVSVFDMSGKLIFKGNANADGMIQLNTADMNSGIYVVNVTTGSTVLTSKLIIE